MLKFKINKNRIDENTIKYQIVKTNNEILNYGEFLNLLKSGDKEFSRFFRDEIKSIPSDLSPSLSAYFWECIPVSRNTLNRKFEFVAVKSEALNNIRQDYSSFQEHFNRSNDKNVVSFSSRSGNKLVVPVPHWGHRWSCTDYDDKICDYKDIREFHREAPLEQQEKFWQKIGVEMEKSLLESNGEPRWLSTHGLNITYLHVRIDKSPTYYDFQGYKNFSVEEGEDQNRTPIDYDLAVEKRLIEDIKENIRDWNIEEVATSLGSYWDSERNTWIEQGKGEEQIMLVRKFVEKKYDQSGKLVIDRSKAYYPSDFSEGKWEEIRQVCDNYQNFIKQAISDYSRLSKEQLLNLAADMKYEISRLEAEVQRLKSLPQTTEVKQKIQSSESKLNESISFFNKLESTNPIGNRLSDNFPVVPVVGVAGLIFLLAGLIVCQVKKTQKVRQK